MTIPHNERCHRLFIKSNNDTKCIKNPFVNSFLASFIINRKLLYPLKCHNKRIPCGASFSKLSYNTLHLLFSTVYLSTSLATLYRYAKNIGVR